MPEVLLSENSGTPYPFSAAAAAAASSSSVGKAARIQGSLHSVRCLHAPVFFKSFFHKQRPSQWIEKIFFGLASKPAHNLQA